MDAPLHGGGKLLLRGQLPQANLAYEKLVKAFPNNRYLDMVDQRRFLIARHWLDLNRAESRVVLLCQLVRQGPAVARCPRARAADFRQDRVDDPTGRLSDDATLAAANEHFAGGEFLKADEKYTDLRQAYPSSEHQFLAHFLGLKAKLNCYQGPAYGGTLLDEAEKLVKQIRRQFPQEAERERIYLDRGCGRDSFHKAERLNASWLEYYDKRLGVPGGTNLLRAGGPRTSTTRRTPSGPSERIGQIAGLCRQFPPSSCRGSSTCCRKATR